MPGHVSVNQRFILKMEQIAITAQLGPLVFFRVYKNAKRIFCPDYICPTNFESIDITIEISRSGGFWMHLARIHIVESSVSLSSMASRTTVILSFRWINSGGGIYKCKKDIISRLYLSSKFQIERFWMYRDPQSLFFRFYANAKKDVI